MNEVDVTPTDSVAMEGLDPLYKSIYGESGASEVAPRQIGYPLVPVFTHYVLKIVKATRRRSQTNVGVRLQAEVAEGPEGTVGMKFTESSELCFGFLVGRQKKGVEITEDQWKAKCRSRNALFNRVRQVLGLSTALPANCFIGMRDFPDAAIDEWCKQFDAAASFIGSVVIEKGQDGVDRNRIDWGSTAGLGDPETDQRGRETGLSALEGARAKIAAYKAPSAK